jgi:hypothetical protein
MIDHQQHAAMRRVRGLAAVVVGAGTVLAARPILRLDGSGGGGHRVRRRA